jgi:hypothetical protein
LEGLAKSATLVLPQRINRRAAIFRFGVFFAILQRRALLGTAVLDADIRDALGFCAGRAGDLVFRGRSFVFDIGLGRASSRTQR